MAQEISKRAALEQFKTYVKNRADLDSAYAFTELNEAQLDKVLTATSEDDLFASLEMAGLIPLKSLETGTEIQINGYHYVHGTRDDYANSLGVFVVIEAQLLSNGQELTLDTGIDRVIGFLRMVESGQAGVNFPVSVVVHKIGTGSGNEMVTFKRLPPRAVKADKS